MNLERDVSNTRGLYTDLVSGFYFPSSGTWNVAVQFEMRICLGGTTDNRNDDNDPSQYFTHRNPDHYHHLEDPSSRREQTSPSFLHRDVLNQHKAADGRDGNSSQQRP